MQLSLEKGIPIPCRKSEIQKELNLIKKGMIELISQNTEILETLRGSERSSYLQRILAPSEPGALNSSSENSTNLFFHRLKTEAITPQNKKTCALAIPVIQALGLALTGSYLWTYGIYGKSGAIAIYDDPTFGDVSMGAIILSSAYLIGFSVAQTAGGAFQTCVNLLTGRRTQTLSEQLRPKLTFGLKAFGLLTAVFSWAPTVISCKDQYENEGLAMYMEVTVSMATILFLATAVLDTSDQIVAHQIAHFGTEEEKQLINFNVFMQKLKSAIEDRPFREFAAFTQLLSPEVLGYFVEDVTETSQKLNEFVSSFP